MVYSLARYDKNCFNEMVTYDINPRVLLLANNSQIRASKPMPAAQLKNLPLIKPWSIVLMLPVSTLFMAFSTFFGMPKVRAKPLPDPRGIMPNTIGVLATFLATSFTVPSPPTATTVVYLPDVICLRISSKLFLSFQTKISKGVLPDMFFSITSTIFSFLLGPEFGFTTNAIRLSMFSKKQQIFSKI